MWCLDPVNSPELMMALRAHWRAPATDIAWVGEGWRHLVARCHAADSERFPTYELLNIKQKWGELAFQAFPRPWSADDPTWSIEETQALGYLIEPFVEMSRVTCEWCGERGTLREQRQVEVTLCDYCDEALPEVRAARTSND